MKECLHMSAKKELVPDDKFDKHMQKARVDDIDSRKSQFVRQSEQSVRKNDERKNLKSSIY